MDERSFTMKTNEERLNELLAHLDSLDPVSYTHLDVYKRQHSFS